MKKLQNNFTTPEQSKRLLELGLPADSADCHYGLNRNMIWIINEYDKIKWDAKVGNEYHYLPCWSVGRLIEIYETCTACLFERRNPQLSILEDVLSQIAEDIMATDECWDFSKLED